MSKRIKVGFIRKPHGLKGFLKVTALTDFPQERFVEGAELYLVSKQGDEAILEVDEVRWQGVEILVRFCGFETVESVQQMRGGYLCLLESEERLELEEDDFYLDDLVNLEVSTVSGKYLGRVKRVHDLPANPVLEVGHKNKEYMVPFMKATISEVNLEEGTITLEGQYVEN